MITHKFSPRKIKLPFALRLFESKGFGRRGEGNRVFRTPQIAAVAGVGLVCVRARRGSGKSSSIINNTTRACGVRAP